VQPDFTIGDSVIFDNCHLEQFVQETNHTEELRQYQKIVVAGMKQTGTVKEFMGNLTTVAYPDGWELPVPTKYLLRHQRT
jgi:hypothetical protein